jgi:hypothetical protein
MRVLHVMASRANGGAETYSTDVMLSLHREGLDQCAAVAPDAPRTGELRQSGLRLATDALASPFRPLQRYALQRFVARERPDIIHCWMRRAASLVPLQPHVIGWFGGYYDPSKFQRCDWFVGVTGDIVAHMVRKGVDPRHARYIPTFPDVADDPPVDRASLATPPDAKVLLALSRLHPKKGLDTLMSALASLPDCVLWLAGEGELRADLERLAARLGVTSRVHFLGWRSDRAALLRAADVCVLPSRYEPFGTVILEAWAARTALVACASAGPAAHVEDGATGLLTPIDDAPALAAAIRRVLDDNALREAMVEGGYAAWRQRFTREAVTRQWLDLYREISAG